MLGLGAGKAGERRPGGVTIPDETNAAGRMVSQILDVIVLVCTIAALPVMVYGIASVSSRAPLVVIGIYFTAYFCFPLLWFGRRRLSFSTRAMILTGATLALSGTLLMRLGLSGPGPHFLFAFAVLATMFFGLRAGLGAVALGAGVLLSFAVAVSAGWVSYPAWVLQGSNTGATWVLVTLSFLVVAVAIVYGPGLLFLTLSEQRCKLLAANERLQGEILERLEAETESHQLRDQLVHAQKMEAIGRLSGGVAHEFNNVLVAMQANAELLATETDANSGLREPALEIVQACHRASGLTRQLLAFSRKEPTKLEVIDFDDLVRSTRKLIAPLVGDDVEVVYELTSGAHTEVDTRQVGQILINLITNARDATPRGGHIWVRTSSRSIAAKDVPQGVDARAGQFVVLEVRDDGSGMSLEVGQRLFEPFFTTKPEGKGTGLGLSMVFGITRKLGGFMEWDTTPGQGSTFRVHFPACVPVAEVEPGAPRAEPLRGNERILLVEDDPLVQRASRRTLARLGYVVTVANHGEEAWELYREDPAAFDLLLTDLSMPGLGGLELAHRIRQHSPDAKVLFVSGYTPDEAFKVQVDEEGIPFLAKPFDTHTLAAQLRTLLDG
ncbi:MAG: response regulator [Deltaproteobacteria bacterium]|nr:response regulator [Deltaproteobacteria bacterium]